MMREVVMTAPPILPIFRSQLQGELLSSILLSESQEFTLTELAETWSAAVSTVQREIDRLELAGLVKSRRVGRSRVVSAATLSASYQPLRELVLRSFGPAHAVRQAFATVRGIEELFIFGSWAARMAGEVGTPPGDIDVLVIGNPDRDSVYGAALAAEKLLRQPVNTTIRTAMVWNLQTDGFVKHVRASPLVSIPHGDQP
jgi:predicted nucleotidyltransferase/DNA-binding transcriptional regulator YhcF (GntR family)